MLMNERLWFKETRGVDEQMNLPRMSKIHSDLWCFMNMQTVAGVFMNKS